MKIHKKLPGQSLLEFALVLPILLLLIMGLFDIGRAIFYYAILNTAVREGTRYAVVQPSCSYKSNPATCTGSVLDSYPLVCDDARSQANINICNEITAKYYTIPELTSSTITIDHFNSSTDDPKIQVEIDFLFSPVTPGIAMMGDLTMHVNSQMIMVPIAVP